MDTIKYANENIADHFLPCYRQTETKVVIVINGGVDGTNPLHQSILPQLVAAVTVTGEQIRTVSHQIAGEDMIRRIVPAPENFPGVVAEGNIGEILVTGK